MRGKQANSMKRLLLILIFCMVVFPFNSVNAEVKKEAGYISLKASKTIETEPNKAHISFSVETSAGDSKKAAAANNEISNKIISALKEILTGQTDTITTDNFYIRPNYVYGKDNAKSIKNYTAVNSVAIDTQDIKKIAQIIDTAVSNGATGTNNLSYSYENSSSVCAGVYPQLMKELKEQAADIASAAGTSLDGVKYMSTSCSSNVTLSNRKFYAAKTSTALGGAVDESAQPPVEAGKVKVRAEVNADYYVK